LITAASAVVDCSVFFAARLASAINFLGQKRLEEGD
jgi:hypothetical protein